MTHTPEISPEVRALVGLIGHLNWGKDFEQAMRLTQNFADAVRNQALEDAALAAEEDWIIGPVNAKKIRAMKKGTGE